MTPRASNIQLSVIILTHHRVNLLSRCLESIQQSSIPKSYELIVVINGVDDAAVQFLTSFIQKNPNLKFYPIPKTTNGQARNEGIKHARGEIYYFLDDDVIVRKDTFEQVIRKFDFYPDTDVIGGPNLIPEGSSFFQRCSSYVLSSSFGAGKMRRRYAASGKDAPADDQSLILCNLALRSGVLKGNRALFHKNLTCSEENLMLQKLKSEGHKMLYSPDVVVYHERRKDLKGFARQIFGYGRGRTQQRFYLPNSVPLFTLMPSFFILYLFLLLFFHPPLWSVPLSVYLFLDLSYSLRLSLVHKNLFCFFLLTLLYPSVHISYGLGSLYGMKDLLWIKKKNSG